ncbi:hypothetical protein HPB51_024164 [Rhipicephalus microplus]|uniref:THAP-type domain-containing protein n=1 Tax=Rhipicephalus microplus TaxID=6941 RepID=A0A9J6DDN2_RHIMP|nr:hypothetical protein HPB51_024164 [Rhipicephalus microplus]
MSTSRRRNYCCVVGCQTGYSRVKNQPKLSLFGVPQDEERRRLWDQNLNRADRPLQVTDAICELHFEQKYILRQYVHIIEGREVYIERGKPELRSDAVPIIIPHLLKCPDEQPTPEQSTKKRAASPPTCEDQPSKRTALQSVEPQLRFEDCESARQSDNAFELEDVVRPNDHWAMHKFRHYDGIAYVSASLSRELVSIEKTVLMNYGTDRSEVICRTYVRKTLISEKVAYNLEDAKQVLDCAESLHPCRGAGNVRGDILLKILMEATILVEQAGLFVDHITCDGAPWNRKMWKLAGVSASSKKINGAIQHPVDEMRKLHFISDFPHLLKCLRNGLLQKGFATPDGLVSVHPVREAYLLDRSVRTLKVMPNLTETHLEPNSFEKMRTPFAFQLFGPYVLRGLAFYKEDIERRCGSIEATQLFFSKIQRLITVMTSRFRAEALRPASTDVAFLSNFLDFLNDWESFSDNKRHFLSESTAIGFRVTIANTLSLLKYLTESVGFKYLMTSRLSTDPVEHFFGIVRQSSGCNAHPSPDEFLITVNCLSFYNLAHSVDSANANPDMINALVTVHDRQGLKVTHKKIDDLISQGKLGEVESTIATMPEKFADHIDVTLEKSDSRLIYYTAGGRFRQISEEEKGGCRYLGNLFHLGTFPSSVLVGHSHYCHLLNESYNLVVTAGHKETCIDRPTA